MRMVSIAMVVAAVLVPRSASAGEDPRRLRRARRLLEYGV